MNGQRLARDRRRRRHETRRIAIDRVRNDINVTPLVDVMLVLLIIFMLMTMVMGRGKELSLPQARYYSSEKDKLQPVVSIDTAGNLWLEKTKLGPAKDEATLREMGTQVQAMWNAPKNPEAAGRIYVKVDAMVEFATVKPVLLYLNRDMARQQIDLAIAKESEAR